MLSELYERIALQPDGLRLMAASRLRRRVLVLLHKALDLSGLSQADLAKKLGRRRSAVNQVFRGDGNVRIETLAEYLHEMGYELDIRLVAAGEPRAAALDGRQPRKLDAVSASTSTVLGPTQSDARSAAGEAAYTILVGTVLAVPRSTSSGYLEGASPALVTVEVKNAP